MEYTELITAAITLILSLSATMPFIAKFKLKLNLIKSLVITIDESLADNSLSPAEVKHIVRLCKDLAR